MGGKNAKANRVSGYSNPNMPGLLPPFGGAPFGGLPFGGAPLCGAPLCGAPFGGAPFGGSPFAGPIGIVIIVASIFDKKILPLTVQ